MPRPRERVCLQGAEAGFEPTRSKSYQNSYGLTVFCPPNMREILRRMALPPKQKQPPNKR